jgi:predicted dehydrogenase
MRVAVVGLGSIGKRHSDNLRYLGHEVVGTDIKDELVYDVDCAFICSPTQFHTSHALLYLEKNIPVFIEKPLSYSLEDLESFMRKKPDADIVTMVGCNMRYHPSVIAASEFILKEQVVHARATFGYDLRRWRAADYRQSYSASRYGGIILDDIHEYDYLYWLFGKFQRLAIVCDRVSTLEIDQEDIAEASILFASRVTASIHQDYLSPVYRRRLELTLANGSEMCFDLSHESAMYINEISHFLYCVTHKKQAENSIREAYYVTKEVLQAKSRNYPGTTYLDTVPKEDTARALR